MICETKIDDGYYWWKCDDKWQLVSFDGGSWYWCDGGYIHPHIISDCVVIKIHEPDILTINI